MTLKEMKKERGTNWKFWIQPNKTPSKTKNACDILWAKTGKWGIYKEIINIYYINSHVENFTLNTQSKNFPKNAILRHKCPLNINNEIIKQYEKMSLISTH